MTNELNDSLDDLFNAGKSSAAPFGRAMDGTPHQRSLPPDLKRAAEVGGFFAQCGKCRGTGQTPWGRCFQCNGKGGKSYKTSPATRAKNREQAATRAANRQQRDVEAFTQANPEIAALIFGENVKNDFLRSMADAVRKWGHLTDRQMAACQKFVETNKTREIERAERAANAPTVDVSRIVAAFDKAREKATRTGQMGIWTRPVKLQADGQDMVVQVAKPGSKWAGTLFVESTDGKRLGYVKDGRYNRPFACTDAEAAAVLKACSDPEQAAVAYGKAWSVCCICNQTLTNDESIARGIGPICASNYGW